MATIAVISYNLGIFSVLSLGAILSWRHVSLVCALFPICCLIAVFFVIYSSLTIFLLFSNWFQFFFFFSLNGQVVESPFWLLSKDRSKDAQKSLQWLRGWVTPQTIHKEFMELQRFSYESNACATATFCDKIKELKRKRNIKPSILCFTLYFFYQFSLTTVWQPYIIQVLNALGTPINASLVTIVSSSLGIAASIVLISTIKLFGRRKLYLSMIMTVAICSFGLS